MNKVVISLIVLAVLAVLSTLVYWQLTLQPQIVLSDNPSDWVKEEGKVKKIDFFQATKAQGEYNVANEQIDTGVVRAAFSYWGIYAGDIFKKEHKENGVVVMELTPDLNPGDGIPQGIVVERIDGQKVVAQIFLDGDWKKKYPGSNIVWGREFEKEKQFEWNLVKEGVYLTTINDDNNRFSEDFRVAFGGLLVGSVTSKQLRENNLKEVYAIGIR